MPGELAGDLAIALLPERARTPELGTRFEQAWRLAGLLEPYWYRRPVYEAQRWLAPPLAGFTTILLLPAALPFA